MTYSSHIGHGAPVLANIGRVALAPLRAIGLFFDAIVAANRLARDVEKLSRLSDAKLAERGLARDGIIPHLARTAGVL